MAVMYIFPYCLWTSRYSLVVPKVSLFESFYPGTSDIKHNDLSANPFFSQNCLVAGASFAHILNLNCLFPTSAF